MSNIAGIRKIIISALRLCVSWHEAMILSSAACSPTADDRHGSNSTSYIMSSWRERCPEREKPSLCTLFWRGDICSKDNPCQTRWLRPEYKSLGRFFPLLVSWPTNKYLFHAYFAVNTSRWSEDQQRNYFRDIPPRDDDFSPLERLKNNETSIRIESGENNGERHGYPLSWRPKAIWSTLKMEPLNFFRTPVVRNIWPQCVDVKLFMHIFHKQLTDFIPFGEVERPCGGRFPWERIYPGESHNDLSVTIALVWMTTW